MLELRVVPSIIVAMTSLRPLRPLSGIALLAVSALALSACGSGQASEASAADGVSIVASTNVYGDIASAIAGDDAEVRSIITSAAQDPHEYEASAQDRLAFNDADIVIENGGGYDSFVDTLLESAGSDPHVIDAVEVSGLSPEEDGEHADEHSDEHSDEEGHAEEGHSEEGHEHVEGFNEHVWYDFHTVEKVAADLRDELSELDPDNADAYAANYDDFAAQVADLESQAEALRADAEGRHAMITEPVPLYLLTAVGLDNLTPEDFSEAVEEGADVPPRVLQETLDLFGSEDIAVLAYNAQTSDATTEEVQSAAESATVPVVDFSETLPESMTYVQWQQANLDALADALGQK